MSGVRAVIREVNVVLPPIGYVRYPAAALITSNIHTLKADPHLFLRMQCVIGFLCEVFVEASRINAAD